MSKFRIYLSGSMQDIDKESSSKWRRFVKQEIGNAASFFDPWDHFDFNMKDISEREVMNFDIWNLKRSDLLICNINFTRSLGTMSELAIAYDRRIPILAINTSNEELHPWQKTMCEKIFDNWEDLIDYVVVHYLEEGV